MTAENAVKAVSVHLPFTAKIAVNKVSTSGRSLQKIHGMEFQNYCNHRKKCGEKQREEKSLTAENAVKAVSVHLPFTAKIAVNKVSASGRSPQEIHGMEFQNYCSHRKKCGEKQREGKTLTVENAVKAESIHRPVKSLFKPQTAPIVGGCKIGEMLFEVVPSHPQVSNN